MGHDTWVSKHITIQVVISMFVLSVSLSLSVIIALRGKSHMSYLTHLMTNITQSLSRYIHTNISLSVTIVLRVSVQEITIYLLICIFHQVSAMKFSSLLQCKAAFSDLSTCRNLFWLLLPQNSSNHQEIKRIIIAFSSRTKCTHQFSKNKLVPDFLTQN